MNDYSARHVEFYRPNKDRYDDRNDDLNSEGYDKPKFNVNEPFLGIISIQMNQEFADRLVTFLEDIDGVLEPEIWAFKKAIADPQGCRDFRKKKKLKRHDGDDR